MEIKGHKSHSLRNGAIATLALMAGISLLPQQIIKAESPPPSGSCVVGINDEGYIIVEKNVFHTPFSGPSGVCVGSYPLDNKTTVSYLKGTSSEVVTISTDNIVSYAQLPDRPDISPGTETQFVTSDVSNGNASPYKVGLNCSRINMLDPDDLPECITISNNPLPPTPVPTPTLVAPQPTVEPYEIQTNTTTSAPQNSSEKTLLENVAPIGLLTIAGLLAASKAIAVISTFTHGIGSSERVKDKFGNGTIEIIQNRRKGLSGVFSGIFDPRRSITGGDITGSPKNLEVAAGSYKLGCEWFIYGAIIAGLCLGAGVLYISTR